MEKDLDSEKSEIQKPADYKRLWIGNLDPRINEYHLLKLLQKYGAIEKFDLLFHRTGPLIGQPRGYAFVTYSNKNDALQAKSDLNNKLVGCKNIIATWAHSMSGEEMEKPKPEVKIPALAMAKAEKKVDRISQIQAIEAKLKLMEKKNSDELEINKTVATEAPIIAKYQFNKQQTSTNNPKLRRNNKKNDAHNKPYSRHRR